MRILAVTALLVLALPLAVDAQRRPASFAGQDELQKGIERKVAAEPDVQLSLCLASGDVFVRGWDKNEVRASSDTAGRIVFRPAKSGKGLEILVSDDPEEKSGPIPPTCEVSSDVELDVPRGATVRIKVREGDVEVSNVGEAHVESLNGDVSIRGVGRVTDVSCMSGDISLSDAKGRVRLRSVSGYVEASNVAPLGVGDELIVQSTSGDLSLDRIGHSSVKGTAISGGIRMSGPLVNRGTYEFSSTSGDVTLELPSNASFRVNARVVFSGEIITDFPVTVSVAPTRPGVPDPPDPADAPGKPKPRRATPHEPPTQTVLAGVVGKGDAELKLTSFSGTVYLKKL